MKKYFALFVLVILVTNSYSQTYSFSAECETGQTLYYQIEDGDHNEVSIVAPGCPSCWTGYVRPVGNMVIPERINYQGNNYTVVKINGGVFKDCPELTSVVVPNTVTYIGKLAFFEDTALESVVLPNGLSSIEDWTFCGCSSLASVNLPDSLVSIGELAFHNCSSLISICLPNTLETLENAAFGNCSSLSGNLVLPGSLQSLGESCFYNCSGLNGVVLSENLDIIPESAFVGCSGLSGNLVIPDHCTLIESEAFSGCSSLSSLTIGSSVTTIGHSAFMNCMSLESIHCNTLSLPYTAPIQNNYYQNQHAVFYNVPTDIPVYVNCLAIDQFSNSANWGQFTNMQGVFLGFPTLTVDVNNPDFGTAEVVAIPSDCDDITVTVRAIPYISHVFGYWKKNGVVVSYQPEYSFALDHNSDLIACFDCSIMVYDSIGYPDQVIGRKRNTSNQVTAEYVSDFSYNPEGVLERFYFQSGDFFHSTQFLFYEFPSKPNWVSTNSGWVGKHTLDPPVSHDVFSFTYEDDHQIKQSNHYGGDGYEDEFHHHFNYYYNDHRLYQKDFSYDQLGETLIGEQNRYSYDNGYKTQIDSAFSGTTMLSSVTINQYDGAHRILSSQTTNYNASGAITAQTRKTYTYTTSNKTDTIITQTLSDGEWINSGIAHYIYDFKDRVIEYQIGSWSSENPAWNITKKILYDFDDEAQKVTISFRKKTEDDWIWDVFSGQSLFNDSQLYEYQRQLNTYNSLQVNQFEISLHYNTVEQQFPVLSEWYYEILNDDGSVTYQHLEYTADTTINNDKTKVIVRTNQIYDKKGQTEVTHEYIKEQDNKVYWWNKELQEFVVLYDYLAEEGDEWEIKVGTESITMHVDSVDLFEYGGETHKRLYISDDSNIFNGEIVVGFGHLTSFFPEKLLNRDKGFRVDGLRCYWVGNALLYHHGEDDCDAIYSEVHEVDETLSDGFQIYPNPTDGVIFVGTHGVRPPTPETHSMRPYDEKYRITNVLGQTLMTGTLSKGTIDVSDLPKGMYFLTIDNHTVKLMKQ